MTTRAPSGDDGFVLVSVLWAVVLIVAVSALFVNVVGQQAYSGAAFERNAMAEAVADGAIRAVAYRLAFEMPSESTRPLPRNGVRRGCWLSKGHSVQVAIQDLDGLVDINRAPLALIGAALGSLPADERARVLATIEARRAAPVRQQPAATSMFASTDELRGAWGLAIGESAILDLLTVSSGSDGFDPKEAPADLLRQTSAAPPSAWVRPSRSRMFAITAVAGQRLRGRSARRAVVELIRQPEQPFAIRTWETISGPSDDPSPNYSQEFC